MYDLVIMDVDMPIMNGWNATIELKKMAIRDEISNLCPIVAHTAFTNDLDRQRCFEAGMAWFLPKPTSKSEVLELIQQFLP
jgi:CheY-like chemotaxis protein